MRQARYVMVGGFLGAGKTTAIVALAKHLASQGLRAGLITNDQSMGLVDTARVRAAGFPVEEITGGCFCCKFNSLVEAAAQLTRATTPDVLIAEPVGSCTDIKATVSYPLRKLYGDAYTVAPLSVLVDPVRAARMLGLMQGKSFSDKVLYVYRKQLEEAELLVINKIDLLDTPMRQKLVTALGRTYPQAKILEVSCQTGNGLPAWFAEVLTGTLGHAAAMGVDYDTYAEGEALLGWLNATATVKGAQSFDGNALLTQITEALRRTLASSGIEVAHLKMTLIPEEGPDLGSISLTRTEAEPVLTHRLQDQATSGMLTINLRAEADPAALEAAVRHVLAAVGGVRTGITDLRSFRPGRPTPTHRMEG